MIYGKTSYPTSLSPHQRDEGDARERRDEKRRDAKCVLEKGQFNFYYVFAVSIVFHTVRSFVLTFTLTHHPPRPTELGKVQGL